MPWYVWLLLVLVFGSVIGSLLVLRSSAKKMPLSEVLLCIILVIGAIGAALTLKTRRGGLLLALVVLPLYIPTLIFGIAAIKQKPNMPKMLRCKILSIPSNIKGYSMFSTPGLRSIKVRNAQ